MFLSNLGIAVQISAVEIEMLAAVDGILLEQNDEWAVRRSRCMTRESVMPVSDDSSVRPPAVAAGPFRPKLEIAVITPP